jgi:hypothetical protein
VTGIGKTAETAEEDDDLLDEPGDAGGDDEEVGVADADELLLHDLGDEPEDVGLDTEALGGAELGASLDADDADEGQAGLLDDAPLEVESEIDADGEEHGWTEDSEGASEGWDEELPPELAEDGGGGDAGEEGVDDPLLDGLPEEGLPDLHGADDEGDDDAWADEVVLDSLPAGPHFGDRQSAARLDFARNGGASG